MSGGLNHEPCWLPPWAGLGGAGGLEEWLLIGWINQWTGGETFEQVIRRAVTSAFPLIAPQETTRPRQLSPLQAAGSSPCSPGGMFPGIVEGHAGLAWFGQSLSRDPLVFPTSDLNHTTFFAYAWRRAVILCRWRRSSTRLNTVKLIRCEIFATFVREA